MPPTNTNTSLTTPTTTPSSASPNSQNHHSSNLSASQKESTSSSQQLRPPLYNAEDYASALRALFTTALSFQQHHHHHQPTSLILEHSTTHPPVIPGQGVVDMNRHVGDRNSAQQKEMGMKKFINGSELLFKLEADLRSAFPSFVGEFVSGESDGVSCILDALRNVHESLDHVNGLREQRKLVMDERSCVQCLHLVMVKNLDAVQKLLTNPHGLYPVVQCCVSTNTSTRILALEILTAVCVEGEKGEGSSSSGSNNRSGEGIAYSKLSEAFSTLRLRLGEPIRCKVLVGAIGSAAAGIFQATGIRFLRSFVGTAPSARFKVYLQVELEDAGFNVEVIRKSAELSPARESRLVLQELDEWDRVVVDVDTVVRQNSQLRNSVATLQQEIATLKDKLKKQEGSGAAYVAQASKFTKRKQQQHLQHQRNLSSTPIQTITTPVDSEEEAEQIHQILEDLNNIVNNEMLNNDEVDQQALMMGSSSSESTTTGGGGEKIVPILNALARPPPQQIMTKKGIMRSGIVASEPNLFEGSSLSSSSTMAGVIGNNSNLECEEGRVKDVVQQLESSGSALYGGTLPNFNSGGLASKFANFKSRKLEGRGNQSHLNSREWGDDFGRGVRVCEGNEQSQVRVKSLENLENFTLKWKYPVVGGSRNGDNTNKSSGPSQQQLQQPNSLVVLQDYRMNRFGNKNSKDESMMNLMGRGSSGEGGSSQKPGLFSKKGKASKQSKEQQQQNPPVHHLHSQKTFQLSMINNSNGNKQQEGSGEGKVNNMMPSAGYNDLGGHGSGSGGNSSGMMMAALITERVTDLPSGLY